MIYTVLLYNYIYTPYERSKPTEAQQHIFITCQQVKTFQLLPPHLHTESTNPRKYREITPSIASSGSVNSDSNDDADSMQTHNAQPYSSHETLGEAIFLCRINWQLIESTYRWDGCSCKKWFCICVSEHYRCHAWECCWIQWIKTIVAVKQREEKQIFVEVNLSIVGMQDNWAFT